MQAKIEERVLRNIGHVLRTDNNRPTKQMTLGWYAPPVTLTPERKPRHGTIEYWRKVIREAGLDADSIIVIIMIMIIVMMMKMMIMIMVIYHAILSFQYLQLTDDIPVFLGSSFPHLPLSSIVSSFT